MHEGLTAAMALTGKPAAFDPRAIPYVEYTDLEAAGCGLSETQAKEQNIEIKIGKFPWSASGRAATMAENEGLTKLIFDAATNRLLGVGIIGSDAGKLISEGALALEMGAVAEDIAYTIHPHPTLSETIMEAAHAVIDRSIHI
jgi:dihydrolipoamide dehydrogenase